MYSSPRRNTRTQESLPWNWILIVSVVIFSLFALKWLFGSSNEGDKGAFLTITPREQSTVYISMSTASKNRIEGPEKLFATDKSVSVELGSAHAENEYMKVDLDKNTELTYKAHASTGEIVGVNKGRAWFVAKSIPVVIELKNFRITVSPGNIVMVEQNNAYSIAYSLQGSAIVSTEAIGTYNLQSGNRIMVGASDLATGTTSLASLAGSIDESIKQNNLFMRNDGESLLKQSSFSGSTQNLSGSLNSSSGLITQGNHVIEITDPIDGSLSKTNTVTVIGKILSKEVKRVTINDKDASVSPVNESFILQNVAIDKDIVNLVYKAYDDNNSLMEKGVFVVFGSKGARDNQGRLESNSFPLSNKDFRITFPSENPYKTTDSFVKVQGSVPKDAVEYIVVNDYRLQKFIPRSTTWYYYANTDTKSMVDGINLYTIKFYGPDDVLLYSQLFTIVKESKNAQVSGEIIR